MGYRSDVALALEPDAAMLLKILANHNKNLRDLIRDCHTKTGWYPDDRGVTKLFWESVKWYNSYKEIECIEEFLAHLTEEEYYFIRLGEECDDVEKCGQFYEAEMYVMRSISF